MANPTDPLATLHLPCVRCLACPAALRRRRKLLPPSEALPDTQRSLLFRRDGEISERQRKQPRRKETTPTRRTRQYPTTDNACPDQLTPETRSRKQYRESSFAIFGSSRFSARLSYATLFSTPPK